jgi:hypothetical protein
LGHGWGNPSGETEKREPWATSGLVIARNRSAAQAGYWDARMILPGT